jgi:hypothetical protein
MVVSAVSKMTHSYTKPSMVDCRQVLALILVFLKLSSPKIEIHAVSVSFSFLFYSRLIKIKNKQEYNSTQARLLFILQ